jgi:hypothetical protein
LELPFQPQPLVIVLSAFNGIEQIVIEINSAFEQDIRIESNQTKTFSREYIPAVHL